jgi:hypothetical protein
MNTNPGEKENVLDANHHPTGPGTPEVHRSAGASFVSLRVHSWLKWIVPSQPYPCSSVMVCVQSNEALVKQGGVWKLSNQLVGECESEHHGWLLETLGNGLGLTLRIRD